MPTTFCFFLAVLATWRLAFLLVQKDGLWCMFARMRNRLGTGLLSQLLGCVKCVGMGVAIPFAFFVRGNWVDRTTPMTERHRMHVW
jgi:hypothetical protein